MHLKRRALSGQVKRLAHEAPRMLLVASMTLVIVHVKTASQIRLQNLQALVVEAGTLEKVAEAVGSTSVYLSQLRNGAPDRKSGRAREMGTSMARRLEAAFHKPNGWMDQDHSPIAPLVGPGLPTPLVTRLTANEHTEDEWPFPGISQRKISALGLPQRLQLQGALLLAAAQMNVKIAATSKQQAA